MKRPNRLKASSERREVRAEPRSRMFLQINVDLTPSAGVYNLQRREQFVPHVSADSVLKCLKREKHQFKVKHRGKVE